MTTDAAPDLDATQSRQARWGRHAFVILIVSTALVVVAFAVIWATHAGGFAGVRGNAKAPAAVAPQEQAPPPQPKVDEPGYSPPPAAQQPSAQTPS